MKGEGPCGYGRTHAVSYRDEVQSVTTGCSQSPRSPRGAVPMPHWTWLQKRGRGCITTTTTRRLYCFARPSCRDGDASALVPRCCCHAGIITMASAPTATQRRRRHSSCATTLVRSGTQLTIRLVGSSRIFDLVVAVSHLGEVQSVTVMRCSRSVSLHD